MQTMITIQKNNPVAKLKIKFAILCFLLGIVSLGISAQSITFSGPGAQIADSSVTEYDIEVANVPQQFMSPNFGLVSIQLNITHPYLQNLRAILMTPRGTVIKLFTGVGGNSQDMTNTILSDTASTAIAGSILAPYTGYYKPEELLGNANNYQSLNGTWKLFIFDDALTAVGTLNYWNITFGSNASSPSPFSSNIPVIYINTYNQPLDNLNYDSAYIRILNHPLGNAKNNVTDSVSEYQGNAEIKIRGQYTLQLPQKSYGLSLLSNS